MNAAVQKWIPVYMTGRIDSYYYPKLKDSTIRRTLFVAPGISAVTSNSVGEEGEGALTIYINDGKAINTLANEFDSYKKLCLPAFNKYSYLDKESLWMDYIELLKKENDSVLYNLFPAIFTMPKEVKKSIESRLPREFDFVYNVLTDNFNRLLRTHKFTEVIPVSKIIKFRNDINLPEFSTLFGINISYTRTLLKIHLENMIHLLRTNENYSLVLVEDRDVDEYAILSKDLDKTAFFSLKDPHMMFITNEHRISMALWETINQRVKYFNKKYSREDTIMFLEEQISKNVVVFE